MAEAKRKGGVSGGGSVGVGGVRSSGERLNAANRGSPGKEGLASVRANKELRLAKTEEPVQVRRGRE